VVPEFLNLHCFVCLHSELEKLTDTRLIPHPTNDPSDPLNWSKPWKCKISLLEHQDSPVQSAHTKWRLDLVMTTQFLFLFVSVESALSMGPMFPFFAAEFHLNDTQLSLLTGACVLALGYSNFIIVPCSNIFGRRLTSVVFCLLGVATCIWQALSKSHSSLLAARAVNGIATATSETLLVQVVTDMLFLHERGFWTGVYL
jgi:cyanate permease